MSGLAGKRILITRALEQAQQTEALLRERGALPVLFPCLEVKFHLDEARRGIDLLDEGKTDALFTSANGVAAVQHVLGADFGRVFAGIRVAAVGQQTANALHKLDVRAEVTPDVFSQEGLLDAFEKAGLPERIVFFRAGEGKDLIVDILRAKGVAVELVKVYDTVCPLQDATPVIGQIERGEIDAVLLASSKTAEHYAQRIGDPVLASRPAIAVISPQVEHACSSLGLTVQAVAKKATLEAMLDALELYFDRGESNHVKI